MGRLWSDLGPIERSSHIVSYFVMSLCHDKSWYVMICHAMSCHEGWPSGGQKSDPTNLLAISDYFCKKIFFGKKIGTLSNLYTTMIRNFFLQFYSRKMRISRHFWPKIDNGRCYTHQIWTNCKFLKMFYSTILNKWSVLFIYLLKYKLTLIVFWKLKPEFGKFQR